MVLMLFESGINAFQAFLIIWLTTKCLGKRYGGFMGRASESAAAVCLFLALSVSGLSGGKSTGLTMLGMALPVLASFLYSTAALCGTWKKKLAAAVLFTSLVPIISVLLLGLILAFVITLFAGTKENPEAVAVWSSAGILVIDMAVYAAVYAVMKNREKKRLEEELIRQRHAAQERDMEQIKELYGHLQRTRHDEKHHVLLLKSMLEDSRAEEALDYLDRLAGSERMPHADKVFCSNMTANYVINAKAEKMEQKGICFYCIVCGKIEGISDVDLNIILGNLFDNAIEACEKISEKSISLSVKRRRQYLVLRMENTAGEDAAELDGREIKTTKKDKEYHGYGLESVKEAAKRYDGRVSIRAERSLYKDVEPLFKVTVNVILDTMTGSTVKMHDKTGRI